MDERRGRKIAGRFDQPVLGVLGVLVLGSDRGRIDALRPILQSLLHRAGFHMSRALYVVIEKAEGKYSAYYPDLPGCVATGETARKAEVNMHEALQLHIEGMIEDGESIPESSALAEYMVVS